MNTVVSAHNRQDLAHLYLTLSREDALWSVKYLSDYLYSMPIPMPQEEQPLPAWWNRPLSERTKAMRLLPKKDINSDYKAELIHERIG